MTTTIHTFTSDQRILDNSTKDPEERDLHYEVYNIFRDKKLLVSSFKKTAKAISVQI